MSDPTVDDRLADVVLRPGVLTDPEDGPSRTAAATLSRLGRQGPTRVTELAAAEGVPQPSMSALAACLAAQGLLRRGGDPADARVVLLDLTAEGADRRAQRRARRARRVDAALAALSPDEVRRIADALPALDPSPARCAGTTPPRR
ncbi:MarR family winged helix-turn-helix transcriptional regulator [Geodermatophilus sp. SYSU D00525]